MSAYESIQKAFKLLPGDEFDDWIPANTMLDVYAIKHGLETVESHVVAEGIEK